MRTFTALVCLLGTSFALGQSCPVKVTGSAKLSDPHHVAYTVTVSNPTSRPVEYNARVDFFLKGVKLQGGYENLRGTIPAKGTRVFKGSEAFVEVLKGADQVKVTRVRTCK